MLTVWYVHFIYKIQCVDFLLVKYYVNFSITHSILYQGNVPVLGITNYVSLGILLLHVGKL